jgi:hypothetical protein
LGPSIRQIHAGGGVRGRGEFDIRHGRRALARLLARCARLTRPGDAVPTVLTVTAIDGGSECWDRRFGETHLSSTQHRHRDGLLAERIGFTELLIRVTVVDGGVSYASAGAALRCGRVRVALPRWLAPRVSADERPGERPGRVRTRVSVAVPVAGELLCYSGYIDVEVTP